MFINQVGNIIHQSVKHDKYNILTAITHERYESNLCKTLHNFYGLHKKGTFKEKWNQDFAPVPNNYYLLNENLGEDQIPFWLDFDFVLSQNRFGQHQILSEIGKINNLPLVTLEHTAFMPYWDDNQRKMIHQMRGDMNVFITEWSLESWKFQDRGDIQVIRHAVDTELFKPTNNIRQNYILTVGNDYIGRGHVLGWDNYKNVVLKNNLPAKPVGDTKGFSLAPKHVSDLIKEYDSARIFLNTHNISPVPCSLLEAGAMACGIVSCNTCGIPEFFTHKYDCLLYNNETEMLQYLTDLLNDEDMALELGNNARKTISEKCNIDRFVSQWNRVFEYMSSIG